MEGIRVSSNNFKYAAWYSRLLALVIDMLIVNIALAIFMPGFWNFIYLNVSNLSSGRVDMGSMVTALPFIIFWAAPLVYMILMWGFFSRTLGMFVTKTRVSKINGGKINWLTAIFRAFAYMIAGLPLLLGFLPILFDKKHQGLHDKLTRTIVIYKR